MCCVVCMCVSTDVWLMTIQSLNNAPVPTGKRSKQER